MKILIVRLSSLGDIVLTEPVVRALHRHYPEAEIHYLAKAGFAPILASIPGIDRVWAWSADDKAIRKPLREERYDLLIDLSAKPRSQQIARIVHPKQKVVYDKLHFTRWLITKRLTKKTIDSTVDLYFSALRKLGINESFGNPQLVPDPAREAEIDAILGEARLPLDKTLVGIFPGAAHPTKRWPVAYWRHTMEIVPTAWNLHYVLLGSPGDSEDANAIATGFANVTNLCGRFDTGQLPGIVNRMRIVLSNDSGPMHIAAALGKPQVAIFGSTHRKLGFRPLNPKAIVLESDVPCRPCHLHGRDSCPKGHLKCLLQVTPPHLKKTLKSMLEQLGRM
jgi:heptosyltransferase-2